jgi:hypothetical protein
MRIRDKPWDKVRRSQGFKGAHFAPPLAVVHQYPDKRPIAAALAFARTMKATVGCDARFEVCLPLAA